MRRTYAALTLLSGAVVLYEITLVRIFSFSFWHHFAAMVLSLALLGLSLAGVLHQWRPLPPRAVPWGGFGFAVAAPLCTLAAAWLPFDPTRLAANPWQLLWLLLAYQLLSIPFLLAGAALVALLDGPAETLGRRYAADLMGASAACLGAGLALSLLGGEGCLALAGCLGALATALTASRRDLVFGAALLCLWIPLAPRVIPVPPGHGKSMWELLDTKSHPQARRVFTQWNANARVDLIENTARITWTSNPSHPLEGPPQTQILIDGDAGTPILNYNGDTSQLALLDYTLSSLAYQARRPAWVLIIGAGGGIDVLTALRFGATRVDAVEVNPIIARLVRGPYSHALGDLFKRPQVNLEVAEGRSFVTASQERYDLIQLSLIDTWAASLSGAHSLAEAPLYTVEAFQAYLDHLNEGGVLTVTRWLEQPPRETLRLCVLAIEALKARGQEAPQKNLAVFKLGDCANLLVKPTPFTDLELRVLIAVARLRGMEFVYLPGAGGSNEFTRLLDDPEGFRATYAYDLAPSTDDRPFFFHFGRWQDANPLGSGWAERPYSLSGRLVLVTILIQALPAALAILLLAAWVRRPGSIRLPVYFGCLGLAFMLVEVSLMQRLTLFLGNPVYAVALVLAALLAFSALGSLLSVRLTHANLVLGVLGVTLLGGSLALPAMLGPALAWSLPARIWLCLALLCVPGCLMGMGFPIGVRRAGRERLGWAWAANGVGSVLGPLLGSLLAIDVGFMAVLALGGLIYLAAAFLEPSCQ